MDLKNLKSVSRFYIVQANEPDELKSAIVDEREFGNLQDALILMKNSEAPVKYLKFNYEGSQYKLYPTGETEEYKIIKEPILN